MTKKLDSRNEILTMAHILLIHLGRLNIWHTKSHARSSCSRLNMARKGVYTPFSHTITHTHIYMYIYIPSGKLTQLWKTSLLIAKSSISMVHIFHSKLLDITRGYNLVGLCPQQINPMIVHSILFWLVVSTPLKNMKTNGKDYPIYYGK